MSAIVNYVDPCLTIILSITYLGDDPVPIDGDDPQHITWIYEKATERASQFNISGVSYRLTQV